MSEKIDITYNRLKISFEEIRKFINKFQYGKYSFLDTKVMCYKKNEIWIVHQVRIDFTLITHKNKTNLPSKEGKILFLEESLDLKEIHSRISTDKFGVYFLINEIKVYFENDIRSISESKILNGIKNYDLYQSINAETKCYFAYNHEMSKNKSNNIDLIEARFDDKINATIVSGEDFYKKFMNIIYGPVVYYFILLIFPIYSFDFNVDIVNDGKQKYLNISYNISDELKKALEITYKIDNNSEVPLLERIPLEQNFQGMIEFRVYWYGDEKFITKGTVLYKERINIEKSVRPFLKDLSLINKEINKDPFITKKFSEFETHFLNENLIECLYTLDLISAKLKLKEIIKWIIIELKGFIKETDELADLPSYREFNAKLIHEGFEVPERLHWNLFLPLSEIIFKINNDESVKRLVEHDVLDDLFNKYFAGTTIAVIESKQLKQVTTGVLKNIEEIYQYLRNLIEKKGTSKKIRKAIKELIERDFFQFNLPDYNEFVDLINFCAYDNDFFRITPILLRTICENLMREIFLSCLANKHKIFYFNNGRVRDFSELIALFNLLKDSFFVINYGTTIPQSVIDYLNNIRDDGNLTVHEILNNMEPNYSDKIKGKIKIVIDNLLQLYRRITSGTKNIQIKDQNLINKINKKLNIKNEIEKVKKKVLTPFR